MIAQKILYIIIILSFIFQNAISLAAEKIKNTTNEEAILSQIYLNAKPLPLPEVEFFDINSKPYKFEQFDGKFVIVYFWATWCTSCITKIPDLDKLKKELRKNPVSIIALSEDYKGAEAVKKFFTEHKIKNLPIYIDKSNKVFREMNIKAMPTVSLISPDNKEIGRIEKGNFDFLDELFIEFIKKQSSAGNMKEINEAPLLNIENSDHEKQNSKDQENKEKELNNKQI